jgi:O-antigen/teichoic acid export membrane protein
VNYTTGRFNSVLVPVLAARQHRKELLKELLPPLVGFYSLFLLPVTAFIAVTASDLVMLLLGAKWEGAARPLSIIMIAFAILHISQPPSAQLEVRAFFAPRIIGAGLGAVTLAVCSLALVGRYGLIGIAFAAVVSAAVTAAIHFRASASYLGVAPSEMIAWIMPGLGVAGMVAGAVKLGDHFVLHESGLPAWRLVAMGALALVAFVMGFRLLVSAAKRRMLGKYLPSTASRSAVAIYKVFGLRPSAP